MLNAETNTPRSGEHTAPESFGKLVQFSVDQIDSQLPAWARRSHPIARRHLGAYWKSFTPNITALLEMYTIIALVVLVTVVMPLAFLMVVPTVTVSFVLLPIGGYIYIRTLFKIAAFAAATLADERHNETLDTLRATPLPIYEILLSKGAAAVWRYIEDINLVVLLHLLPSLPLLLVLYNAMLRDIDTPPLVIGLIVVAGVGIFAVRILLETVMITALAMLLGAAVGRRIPATFMTALIALAYFALINAPRLIPLGASYTLFMEWVIPTLLPIGITLVSLRLTRWLLERD